MTTTNPEARSLSQDELRHAAELARTNMIHQCATEEDVIQWLMAFGAGYRAEGMREMREACAKVCRDIEDDYNRRESLKWAELKTDAEYGAGRCAEAIESRQQSAALPSDYVMVPREATEEMLKIGCDILSGATDWPDDWHKDRETWEWYGARWVYKAMLAATGTKR